MVSYFNYANINSGIDNIRPAHENLVLLPSLTLCIRMDFLIHIETMGVTTIYAKTHLRIYLDRKYGIIISQFSRFLDGTHAKCVWKSNSVSKGLYMMALSTLRPPLRAEVKEILIHIRFSIVYHYWNVLIMENSADSDETPRARRLI